MAVSREYAIDTVRLDSAGDYHCQARNEHGQGTVGSAYLDVFQVREEDSGLPILCIDYNRFTSAF